MCPGCIPGAHAGAARFECVPRVPAHAAPSAWLERGLGRVPHAGPLPLFRHQHATKFDALSKQRQHATNRAPGNASEAPQDDPPLDQPVRHKTPDMNLSLLPRPRRFVVCSVGFDFKLWLMCVCVSVNLLHASGGVRSMVFRTSARNRALLDRDVSRLRPGSGRSEPPLGCRGQEEEALRPHPGKRGKQNGDNAEEATVCGGGETIAPATSRSPIRHSSAHGAIMRHSSQTWAVVKPVGPMVATASASLLWWRQWRTPTSWQVPSFRAPGRAALGAAGPHACNGSPQTTCIGGQWPAPTTSKAQHLRTSVGTFWPPRHTRMQPKTRARRTESATLNSNARTHKITDYRPNSSRTRLRSDECSNELFFRILTRPRVDWAWGSSSNDLLIREVASNVRSWGRSEFRPEGTAHNSCRNKTCCRLGGEPRAPRAGTGR